MKRMLATVLGAAAVFSLASGADAYTFKQKQALSVSASGVTESTTFSAVVVTQGTDTPATLSFGSGGNTFRDSGEGIKVEVSTNLAANRIIIYTDNLSGGAIPQAQLDTSLGNDGGGLVGVTDRSQIVPVLWVVKDTNADHAFTTGTIGDDETFLTDRAHVATYVDAVLGSAAAAEKQKLDTLAMKRCDNSTPVANADNAGTQLDPERFPQFFGDPGVFNSDLCNNGADITINGTTILAGAKIPFAEELSKNIAVVAFGFLGTGGTAPNQSTPSPSDTIAVTSPIYLPLGANFSTAPAQDYATNTLTVELVTQ